MNKLPSPLWTTRTTEVNMTGTWRSELPVYLDTPSPCQNACPVNGDIATWIQQVKAKDYHAAWLTLMDNNPFPSIAGRICHHPCESPCNRKDMDEAVAICSLERFVGDVALDEHWAIPEAGITRKEKIAVVGGGPSGLSAAYQLRRRGYAVTLFEAHENLGGLMRYGIPSYRLAKSVLDGEIKRIIDLGVDVKSGLGEMDADAVQKLREEFDAVYLAIGAGRSKKLPGLDYSQPWVMDSAKFLAATNMGEPVQLGDHVVVIGGGSAAMDVARTARRLDKQVSVLSLEPEALLPAQREEVVEAVEEGVRFFDQAMLQTVKAHAGGVLELSCIRVEFEAGTVRGQFKVTPIAGSEFKLEANAIVPALGQEVALDTWSALSAEDSPVIPIDSHHRTRMEGVFAGGDLASLDRFVTQAIGMGKRAARDIEHYFNQSLTAATAGQPEVPYQAINTHYQSEARREIQGAELLEERLKSFVEVQRGLSAEQAATEADRCFSCGHCIFCDNCYFYCPDMAITKLEHGLRGQNRLLQGLRTVRRGMPNGHDCDAGRIMMPRPSQKTRERTLPAAAGTPMLLTGNHAVAWGVKLARPNVIPVYPITPQTPILEKITEFHSAGEITAEIIAPESEHSAISACVTASLTGSRVFTATSSQGLLLMHEVLHYAAGAHAPIVMFNVNRTVASPWGFWPDQTDSLAQRDTGWAQLYSESPQESIDTVIQAFRVAEEIGMPVMVSHDAFYVSHSMELVEVPAQACVDDFLPEFQISHKLDTDLGQSFGAPVDQTTYNRVRREMGEALNQAFAACASAHAAWLELTGREYGIIEAYRTEGAQSVLVTLGSMCGTVREAVDALRDQGHAVGLLKIRLFRPFPNEQVIAALKDVPNVIVLDRNYSPGLGGILHQEIKAALYGLRNGPRVHGLLAGVGGVNVTPEKIQQLALQYGDSEPAVASIWVD